MGSAEYADQCFCGCGLELKCIQSAATQISTTSRTRWSLSPAECCSTHCAYVPAIHSPSKRRWQGLWFDGWATDDDVGSTSSSSCPVWATDAIQRCYHAYADGCCYGSSLESDGQWCRVYDLCAHTSTTERGCLRQSCHVRLGDRPFGLVDWDEVPSGAGFVIQMHPSLTDDDSDEVELLQHSLDPLPWEFETSGNRLSHIDSNLPAASSLQFMSSSTNPLTATSVPPCDFEQCSFTDAFFRVLSMRGDKRLMNCQSFQMFLMETLRCTPFGFKISIRLYPLWLERPLALAMLNGLVALRRGLRTIGIIDDVPTPDLLSSASI